MANKTIAEYKEEIAELRKQAKEQCQKVKTLLASVREPTPLEMVDEAVKHLQGTQFYLRGIDSRNILSNLYAAQGALHRAFKK